MPSLLDHRLIFPDPRTAEVHGLVAVGGDLSAQRLLLAYRLGIFPWFETDTRILWWSPDPRAVILPDRLHISRSLKKVLRQQRFRVTINQAFAEVLTQCAEITRKDSAGTWLTRGMREAYSDLHRRGYAHSVECWVGDELVGGLYGVAMAGMFFGESMFSRRTDASKVAMVALCGLMRLRGGVLVDCQIPNPHLERLGAVAMARDHFLELLRRQGLGQDADVPSPVFVGQEALPEDFLYRLW